MVTLNTLRRVFTPLVVSLALAGLLTITLAGVLLLAGCDPGSASAAGRTATPPPAAGVTAMPTFTPTADPHAPTRVPPATPQTRLVELVLIAIDDNGRSGELVGCGDSAVVVQREVTAYTADPLRTALEALLAIRERAYGESGLVNALYQAELTVGALEVDKGTARVALSGTLMLSGVCDIPRAEAQLAGTIRRAAGVQNVEITLNGVPLAEALSLK